MSFDYDALRARAADAAYGPDAGDNYWPETEIIPLPVTPPTRRRERWQDHAACAGTDPALFFPDLGDTATAQTALAICNQCPVRPQCLNEHIHEKHGVWGGTTAKERVALRRGQPRRDAARCGTNSGHRRHQLNGEPPCDPCKAAHAAYMRDYRTRKDPA